MKIEAGKAKNGRTILVTGAQGVSGRAVVEHYSRLPEAMVYGLSRRESPRRGTRS
jgi:NAD(P)-dependent dehydrogenase (short-subunit alcohol dehydrogenase family)